VAPPPPRKLKPGLSLHQKRPGPQRKRNQYSACICSQNVVKIFMASIKICINDYYKRQDGEAFVYLVTYVKRKRVIINTYVKVKIDLWDPAAAKLKGNGKEINDLNLIITNCRSRLNDIFVRYRLMHRELSAEILREEYESPSRSENFYSFIEEIISKKKGLNSPHTIQTYDTLLWKLKKFRPVMSFSDITCDMVNDFQKFIKAKKTSLPDAISNNPNTVSKTLRLLKVFINEAIKRDLIKQSPFETIKIKRIEADREFLSSQELEKLLKTYRETILPEHYRNALRVFLFSCFTGLRISDVREVRLEDIQKDILVFKPAKTDNFQKTMRIPLTEPAKIFIRDAAPNRLYGRIFQMESDQSINRKLKKIFDGISINKHISFHCARHTFATIFLREGGKVQILQKLLGHYSISETMKYVHILPDDTEEQIKIFNKFA
jgi:integrase